MNEYEVCGKCRFHRYDNELKDFVCTCSDSEAYGLATAYDDYCNEYDRKDKR